VRPSAAKKFWIETWGCQMNELDTQRMAGQLMQSGLLPTRDVEDADLILLNSCSVREKAENKVFSQLGRYRRFKRNNPDLVIGLCGCVAQQVGETALDRNPDLDFVIGPARVGELARILDRRRSGERVVATGFPEERHFDIDTISRAGTYKGMVTVIEGCDKNCTFCVVPLTRGPERCRPLEEIVIEVEHLIEYERLRFVTSYPRDFSLRMVEQFARHSNICPYLHLPVQSGSDQVLKRMGRGYTVAEFRDLVRQLREARPDLALSTDLIVGFPGETEADFQDTVCLTEEVGFASVYAFKYSRRPGTAAVHLPDPVDDATASRRLQELLQIQERIQRGLNEQLVGSEMEVLVTGWAEAPQLQSGRTTCHRIVHFPAEPAAQPLGSIAPVLIEKANPHSLLGRQPDLQ
jgi:tRNA-2-methylthio-N6-dimethylallyladenosine synthase